MRVRDITRPEALPLTRIARLALVATRRLPSPHASGGTTSHSPIPHMHNFSRNNGKKKLSCNFLPSKRFAHAALRRDGMRMPRR
jgi:hypothetical protein